MNKDGLNIKRNDDALTFSFFENMVNLLSSADTFVLEGYRITRKRGRVEETLRSYPRDGMASIIIDIVARKGPVSNYLTMTVGTIVQFCLLMPDTRYDAKNFRHILYEMVDDKITVGCLFKEGHLLYDIEPANIKLHTV